MLFYLTKITESNIKEYYTYPNYIAVIIGIIIFVFF